MNCNHTSSYKFITIKENIKQASWYHFAFLTYTSFNINTTAQFFNGLPRLYNRFSHQVYSYPKTICSSSLSFPNLKFSVSIHDKTLFSSNFLLKASDVQHGYPNIQLMSEFFRFRKSYQWIWLLNRRLPYNLSNPNLVKMFRCYLY